MAALLRIPLDDAVARGVDVLDSAPPGPSGVVRLDVDLPGGELRSWSVDFTTVGVRLVPGGTETAVVRIGLDELVDLVEGRADAALLYLAGRIAVAGDEGLLLDLGTTLRPTGAERAVIDPAALDPDVVSAAIAGATTAHLAAVMSGGFREIVLSEVFRRVPEFLIAEKAAGVRLAVAFRVVGRPDGGTDRYVVRVEDGRCDVTRADTPGSNEHVDATLVLEGHEFLRLVLGHLNPVRGVVGGQVRVEGQVLKALALSSVLRIPGS